jgi:hypothetical protein
MTKTGVRSKNIRSLIMATSDLADRAGVTVSRAAGMGSQAESALGIL